MNYPTESFCPDLDAIGDWMAPRGSEPWAKAMRIGMQRCVGKVDLYPAELKSLVMMALEFSVWTKLPDPSGKPFPSFEKFCATKEPYGLGTPYEKLKPYILAAAGGDECVVAAITTRPEAAPKPGGKRKGAGRPVPLSESDEENQEVRIKNQGSDTYVDSAPQKRDSSYLAARIARDAPAVHEAMKAGQYKSVRAAAKAAGLVKDPDPVVVAVKAFAKVPPLRMPEFVGMLDEKALRSLGEALTTKRGA